MEGASMTSFCWSQFEALGSTLWHPKRCCVVCKNNGKNV